MILIYTIIFILLLLIELLYFDIADKCNIIDKPNQRSSHSTIVLRGGGIIFALSTLAWVGFQGAHGEWGLVVGYLPFLIGLFLIAGVSFVDDIISLPDRVRLVSQFTAMALMFWCLGVLHWNMWWIVIIALIVCVGAINVINFMDGINGITAGYSLAVLVPLTVLNASANFIDQSFLVTIILGVLVFCVFNFRSKGKAKCFAGDVGSIGIAFILLFAIGKLVMQTGDVTYLLFLLVYGVDGCLTICHRILLHEKLGEAHRKHAYQLMANELKFGHVKVAGLYMIMQLAVSLVFIFIVPNTILAHWIYLIVVFVIFAVAYVLFKKKYYHLHEEYLASLEK
ncbi:MraY family glycosyltransferase [Bacteroides ihuae]|uniref:MraY family glycosyltransferase n=1 Tax=Bacteroides ihuae TaxID=1852362 RepID=UPI0008DAEDC3|nr:glycosyltransferase family 4 protein [Bacteroides ihuae]